MSSIRDHETAVPVAGVEPVAAARMMAKMPRPAVAVAAGGHCPTSTISRSARRDGSANRGSRRYRRHNPLPPTRCRRRRMKTVRAPRFVIDRRGRVRYDVIDLDAALKIMGRSPSWLEQFVVDQHDVAWTRTLCEWVCSGSDTCPTTGRAGRGRRRCTVHAVTQWCLQRGYGIRSRPGRRRLCRAFRDDAAARPCSGFLAGCG